MIDDINAQLELIGKLASVVSVVAEDGVDNTDLVCSSAKEIINRTDLVMTMIKDLSSQDLSS